LVSGLLREEQIQQAWAAIERSEHSFAGTSAPSRDELLAAKLVELGWLNVWQAKQLSEGRTQFDLGTYRIVDYIGRGGMGEVYKAEHGVLGRSVAIKILPRHKSTPEDIANFLREARVLARLDHENLVRAFDAGDDGKKRYYLVTEYVPGTDLRKLVRAKGPLSMAQAASIISQVARALQHAHDQGLIHRDVKPGNVLVTPEGRAKLSDLGLAGPRQAENESDPRLGRIVGTPDYLSPDHIEAPWNPTPAWDIYSLGCTLYYAVTGKVPYPGGSAVDKCRAHLQLRPLDPRRLNPKLSDRFVDVIADMMAKNPAERTASANDVAERLAPWAEGLDQALAGAKGAVSAGGPGSLQWTLRPAYAGQPSEVEPGLEETQASVSAIPDVPATTEESSGQVSQTTYPVAESAEETHHTVHLAKPVPEPPLAILAPFAALVLFPLAVVALILLAWWISRIMF
jgi:serine/threonine protein kinase